MRVEDFARSIVFERTYMISRLRLLHIPLGWGEMITIGQMMEVIAIHDIARVRDGGVVCGMFGVDNPIDPHRRTRTSMWSNKDLLVASKRTKSRDEFLAYADELEFFVLAFSPEFELYMDIAGSKSRYVPPHPSAWPKKGIDCIELRDIVRCILCDDPRQPPFPQMADLDMYARMAVMLYIPAVFKVGERGLDHLGYARKGLERFVSDMESVGYTPLRVDRLHEVVGSTKERTHKLVRILNDTPNKSGDHVSISDAARVYILCKAERDTEKPPQIPDRAMLVIEGVDTTKSATEKFEEIFSVFGFMGRGMVFHAICNKSMCDARDSNKQYIFPLLESRPGGSEMRTRYPITLKLLAQVIMRAFDLEEIHIDIPHTPTATRTNANYNNL